MVGDAWVRPAHQNKFYRHPSYSLLPVALQPFCTYGCTVQNQSSYKGYAAVSQALQFSCQSTAEYGQLMQREVSWKKDSCYYSTSMICDLTCHVHAGWSVIIHFLIIVSGLRLLLIISLVHLKSTCPKKRKQEKSPSLPAMSCSCRMEHTHCFPHNFGSIQLLLIIYLAGPFKPP